MDSERCGYCLEWLRVHRRQSFHCLQLCRASSEPRRRRLDLNLMLLSQLYGMCIQSPASRPSRLDYVAPPPLKGEAICRRTSGAVESSRQLSLYKGHPWHCTAYLSHGFRSTASNKSLARSSGVACVSTPSWSVHDIVFQYFVLFSIRLRASTEPDSNHSAFHLVPSDLPRRFVPAHPYLISHRSYTVS
ncbi:hypothetical protein BD626DRAFT_187649 [Schizophyllum amplum]|uniref:Uncharacterized protein n=1 Tax=Schizophyllum amplum TaxID=97359 RepID=A0A550C030_9AGAR|nr:hypothetical protein BD626DRAFT_187649 [Auriculariopsis ampla]